VNTSEANSYYIKAFKKLLIEEGNGDLFPQNLAEQYPHILDKIFLLWVDPASVQIYFSNLLMNNRSSRAGFPPEVYSELFMLESFYAVKHPQIMPRQELWGGVSKRN
jgi:hypothetical protein